ncbi:MAG: hypothetical protein OEO20_09155 [Gemmatimonadota bacterium]|nr:hypothetical protein [Gemmatimonadota bacterium]MDH3368851.1 hypothetical protein [Gemmatimonadota bacterium]MDH3478458.1 hypothetical protein [Gemmatimonadota bacterium]MDH3570758.1 hypothetical protein [Gemmatimonadota bacterium]MDH5549895.1 hypothetical protein [Gemmatimonadota bacterium]
MPCEALTLDGGEGGFGCPDFDFPCLGIDDPVVGTFTDPDPDPEYMWMVDEAWAEWSGWRCGRVRR